MQKLETIMAPLRASRTALTPYIDNMHDRYVGASKYARAQAQNLIARAPKSTRILSNRYVLISHAAGVCLFAASRLQRWRRANKSAKPRTRGAVAKSASAPRKSNRAPSRSAARVH
jgi:hypothetical protein